MDKEKYKLVIKQFFMDFSYNVMHESSKDNVEHYFVVITKDDTKNAILTTFFDKYIIKYPLDNLSKETLDYMKYNKDSYYFTMIGSIAHNDPFFKEKDDFIRKNAQNILCYNMIGEVADRSTHLENTIENYVKKIEGFSSYAAVMAKEKTKQTLKDTKKLLSEKAPIFKQNILSVQQKVQQKIKQLKNKI